MKITVTRPVFLLLFIFISLSFTKLSANEESATILFNRGNEAYRAEQYEQARNNYLEALEIDQSSALHYNLGKCFTRLKKPGYAILHFEKALILEPGDDDIRINLASIRQQEELLAPEYSWLTHYAMSQGLNTWTWIAFTAFWILLTLLLLPRFYAGHNIYTRLILALSVVALFVSGAGLLGYYSRQQEAVALEGDTPLRVAPTKDSQANAKVKAGELVKVGKIHDEYYYVESLGNKTGWATKEEVMRIWE